MSKEDSSDNSNTRMRMKSTLPSSLPWHTGVIRDYQRFSGRIAVDRTLEVRGISFIPRIFLIVFLKGIITDVDQLEGRLFSSRSFTRPQDHLLQKLFGIDVKIEGGVEVVGPCPNGLSDGKLVPAHATRLFTSLCGYRLVDIMALLGENHPLATVVERSAPPTGPLQVRTYNLF